MKNPFPYSLDHKRYHSWNYYLKNIFGEKIFKVALDGGFDCPNRDGTVAYGGCTFCSVAGSGDFAGDRAHDLTTQFHEVKERMHTKWPNAKYIGYFQAYTNTHAPVSELREKYEVILQQENVVGMSIGTRPDCLPDDVVEYLAELNERTFLWVELGLQTMHQQTSDLINRAHDMECYLEGVAKLRRHNINVCTHIINGLPGENYQMMLDTAKAVSEMDVQGIKIHMMHLLKGTPMVKQYEKGLLKFMTKDEYIQLVVDQLELLPKEMIVHRITGDGPPELLIGPMWSMSKWEVLNAIDAEFKKRDSFQGKTYNRLARVLPC
ncbi:hypothetical protein SAMN04488134_111125 [Amphibacillus marinus]|uniref:Radical SAM core domain-containing protein n=1 Tax=Amphibacillus marinus TaxID=872970 RepID=A0A1H8S1R9_9BACI|nr:TIGR01212 family radical SAM protein [Amphibacillus marinus]SEO72621.1 hypothetical protein SAMN04488134_111125 [Amphibacillus marinus]